MCLSPLTELRRGGNRSCASLSLNTYCSTQYTVGPLSLMKSTYAAESSPPAVSEQAPPNDVQMAYAQGIWSEKSTLNGHVMSHSCDGGTVQWK